MSQTTHDAEEDRRNEDLLIHVNGELVPKEDAKVSVYDSGFMLGDGMWEGLRLYNGTWAFFDEHMDRFFNSCKAVSLDVGMNCAWAVTANRADSSKTSAAVMWRSGIFMAGQC